jgi:hypothetical protein
MNDKMVGRSVLDWNSNGRKKIREEEAAAKFPLKFTEMTLRQRKELFGLTVVRSQMTGQKIQGYIHGLWRKEKNRLGWGT